MLSGWVSQQEAQVQNPSHYSLKDIELSGGGTVVVAFGQIDLVVKDEARALPMLFVSLLFMAQQVHRGAVQE